jgi:hypothetical protein
LFYVVCFGGGKILFSAALCHLTETRSAATVSVNGLLSFRTPSGTTQINYKLAASDRKKLAFFNVKLTAGAVFNRVVCIFCFVLRDTCHSEAPVV